MQICKSKTLICCILFSLFFGKLFPLDFPSMPDISSPSMPQMGGTPYGPWNYSSSSQVNSNTQKNTTEDSVKPSAAGQALSAETISGLGGLDALSGLAGDNDLSSYMSALSGLSNLSGNNSNLTSTIQKLANSSNTEVTNSMLEEILAELKTLSEKTANNTFESSTEKTPATSLDKSDFYTPNTAVGSKLLRFRANNRDLLGTCRTVYFSEPEPNGIFLLTGDRVFYIGSELRNETFYFLFRPKSSENGQFIYSVEAEIQQDKEATGSNLFELTKNLPLTATRTGNLVTLRYSSETWNLDMLLDLQEAK